MAAQAQQIPFIGPHDKDFARALFKEAQRLANRRLRQLSAAETSAFMNGAHWAYQWMRQRTEGGAA